MEKTNFMKTIIFGILFTGLFFGHNANAQVLWGTTYSDAGANGLIYNYDVATGTQTVKHNFTGTDGKAPFDNVMQASNGMLYGMTKDGGGSNLGVIFKYDPATDTYTKTHDFDGTNGSYPYGALMEASNGMLYGMTYSGGSSNSGVIFKYDPATDTFTKTHDFDNTNGKNPFGGLMEASNGMLYGMTFKGGTYTYGVIFKYDPATDTYTKTQDFDYTNGALPYGELMQATNGMLYGVTYYGGSSGVGVIFKYDPATDTYTKTHDFDNTNGKNPFGDLMEASNGMLYGMTYSGGGSGVGVIFKYDPATDTYTKTHDFDYTNGRQPAGSFMQASNGLLYAYTFYGGSAGSGTLFSYSTSTDMPVKLLDFTGVNGKNPYFGSLIEVGASSPVAAPANALEFDGSNDYVDATATASGLPQGNAPRTIESWINISVTAGYINILSWGRRISNMRSSIGLRSNHLAFIGEGNDLDGSIVINDGLWHHVAVSYDGSNMSLYVDGVLDISSTKNLNTTDQNLRIGTVALPSSGEYWNGMIDEVRIWDVAKTQTEIQAAMNIELCGSDPNLIVYYDFNQGNAEGNNAGETTLIDKSGNGFDGTLINFALNGPASNWVNSGAVVTPCAVVSWNGNIDSDWHTAGNWDSGSVPNLFTNISIPSAPSNQPLISSAADCNDLVIDAGASLTIQSDVSGTGTLINKGSITNNGTIDVQRYFSGNDLDWHLVSSPVSGASANVFLGMYLQSFDESLNSYTEITDVNMPMASMEGYGLYSTLGAGNTVTFTGDLNTGAQNISYTANSNGWNLFGNPFASSIDWETVSIPSGLGNEVHYIDASSGNDLSYVQGTGGTGSQYIPPMQGFFVKASGSGTFSVGDAQRSHNGSGAYYKNSNPNLLVLKAENESFSDEAWIHFNENAGEEYDGQFDAHKRISNSNPELPQIFSYTPEGTKLSINGMPEATVVPVGFTAITAGEYTISASETGEFAHVTLEDLLTGEQTNLLTSSYTFGFSPTDMEDRFVVHFAPLAIGDNLEAVTNIYSYNKSIYINVHGNTNAVASVYDMMGKEVANASINKAVTTITLERSGYYVVKVIGDEGMVTRKVLIK